MTVKFDRALDCALGNSRKQKTWKNKKLKWSELLDRLANTTRTPETVAEYKKMGRDQQSEIKDVGGFVGGYCNNGSRSNIHHRSVLCLDADFADNELWGDWCLLYGNAAAVYSTHKHTPQKPRLRLVIPLSRDVSPDEYQAIGRRVANTLGIDKFDDTSYQPQRVMYWPSTSYDGEYVFEYLDGPFLEPDTVLATYLNWQDITSWPISSRVASINKTAATKQKDPLEKGGIVGAFCKAYTIQEAIEKFVPTYTPCDEPNRYTYTDGSTTAGVVIYDDKFSYSHHATDPASGQLCNAWDLVRLHKFGALDIALDPETTATLRPSYKAMQKLATEDEEVKAQIVSARMATVSDFDEPIDQEPNGEKNDAWMGTLKVTERGGIAQTIDNVVIILENDPMFKGTIALNEMDHNIVAKRDLPWRKIKGRSQWVDTDDAALRYHLERTYGVSGKDRIFDAVNVVAQNNKFHPIRDYLEEKEWDGIKRVDTLLIEYLGAEDTPYTRAVTRKALVAAVKRIYHPGCKFDYVLTLRGEQGLGKSEFISKLGGPWYSDTFTTVQGKDAYEQIIGVWIMEIGELAGMKKAEEEAIKMYISKKADRFRPAYGRRIQEFPRQCIFIGTTNEQQFLRDPTGGRRWWIVDTPNEPTKDQWEDLTKETVHQIWAEARHLYLKGERIYLPPEIDSVARRIQASHAEENPKAGVIADYLERLLPADWEDRDLYQRRQWLETNGNDGVIQRTTVCTLEIWAEALGGNPDKIDRYASKEIRDLMVGMKGWSHQGAALKTFRHYGRQRYYKRG